MAYRLFIDAPWLRPNDPGMSGSWLSDLLTIGAWLFMGLLVLLAVGRVAPAVLDILGHARAAASISSSFRRLTEYLRYSWRRRPARSTGRWS